MLCGISRLSTRSMIATAIFFTVALITANFVTGGANIPSCKGMPCYAVIHPSRAELVFMLGTNILSCFANLLAPRLLTRSAKSRAIFGYLAGLEFGLGLLISGMADPAKVLRFFAFPLGLDRFDPSLSLIILFGIGPSLINYLWRNPGQVPTDGTAPPKPDFAEHWSLPTATVADIDWRFVAGAAAFGVGWGLCGVCPGPAILRSVLQPSWGLVAMAGYILGNMF